MVIPCNDEILWYLQPKCKVFLQTNSNKSSLIQCMMIYKNIHMYFFFFFKSHKLVKSVIWLIIHVDGLFNFHVVDRRKFDLEVNFSHLKILQLSMFVKGILMEILVSWESQLWLGFFMVVFSMLFWLFC